MQNKSTVFEEMTGRVVKISRDRIILELEDGSFGHIATEELSSNPAERNTGRYRLGDPVKAAVISECGDGSSKIWKMSVRALEKQPRRLARSEEEKLAAITRLREAMARNNEERQRRLDMERERAQADRAARLLRIAADRRRERMARLRRTLGTVAACGLTGVFFLLGGYGVYSHLSASEGNSHERKTSVRHFNQTRHHKFPQEELIRSLPRYADVSDRQLVNPEQVSPGTAPDSLKPVMVMTTSEADRAEDEKWLAQMASRQGLIAARVGRTKYAVYAPDNHPGYTSAPVE